MGRYVDNKLIEGETVLYEAHYHWSVWVSPCFWTAFSVIFIMVAWILWPNSHEWVLYVGLAMLALSLLNLLRWYLKLGFDEFVVTNQRVFIKRGIIAHETTEHHLRKIETVSVEQSFMERLIGRGTLTFSGTGSTITVLHKMGHPSEFRKTLQQAVNDCGRPETPAPAAATAPAPTLTRVEQLERLERLRNNGSLTEEEFQQEKRRVLEQ